MPRNDQASKTSERDRFLIKRNDITGADDVLLAGDALTIGRLYGNELWLNNGAVSRTHAGIKKLEETYWLYSLSESDPTVVNGQLVHKAPLADGDVVQIGPYSLLIRYVEDALAITVEEELQAFPVNSLIASPGHGQSGSLLFLNGRIDNTALDLFWMDRKREAGKINERTLLYPTRAKRIGKAQFYWRPTKDLGRTRRAALLVWSGFLLAFLYALSDKLSQRMWLTLLAILPVAGLVLTAVLALRRTRLLRSTVASAESISPAALRVLDLASLMADGPSYPHPVIDPVLCIGCHGCVEACPHDVLAMVNGIATPIALDQCMEETSCQVECPTNPKACIVINTTKRIPQRRFPERDQRLKTNVDGIYMIGDVSGVPLIKNAINEGAQVIDSIVEELHNEGLNPYAEYDVAIIGVGPAGLSATVIAKQRGLKYIAIEQDRIVGTMQNYPAGKYVFFKPDLVEAKGGLPLQGAGDSKENMLSGWLDAMMRNGVIINEQESCMDVRREDGLFKVITEKGKGREKAAYKARKIIIAIGNRGTAMRLRVPGEELEVLMQPSPAVSKHCRRCGEVRRGQALYCVKCGSELPVTTPPPYKDLKVKYKLSDADDFVGKKCIVVGSGNSAVEAAIDLVGLKRKGDSLTFTRTNEVTLVVRRDFKGDLKLANKMDVYDCIDAGKIKVFFRAEIKHINENEVALIDVRTKQDTARLANDYIFALIGAEKPTKFLEALGIRIGQ